MKDLILIRHAECTQDVHNVTGGWTNTRLTELGQRQAQATAQRVKELVAGRRTELFSSDLERARETGEAIGDALSLTPTFKRELRELDNGKAAGLTWESAKAFELPRTEPILDWVPYVDAESWRMMARRIYAFMEKTHFAEEIVLLVTHGESGKAVIHWWLGLPEEYWCRISYVLDYCSITCLNVSPHGERAIFKLNDTSHLGVEPVRS